MTPLLRLQCTSSCASRFSWQFNQGGPDYSPQSIAKVDGLSVTRLI